MRVLADCHHTDLYESLRILFEDRLGWELYRPIGLEWFHEDYWAVYPHVNTAQQYLDTSRATPQDIWGQPVEQEHGPRHCINKYFTTTGDGIYLCEDPVYRERVYRCVTLPLAKQMGFDLVLSSIPGHFARYEKFCEQYCPQAKHVFQMGNVGWSLPPGVKNLLNSTSFQPPEGVQHVRYHQEFSLDQFQPWPVAKPKSLCNLMHYQRPPYLDQFKQLFGRLVTKGWVFHNYGAGNPDRAVYRPEDALREHGFVWHVKAGGDGYGFNIHNAFACGRPMVVSLKEIRDQIASHLMTDGQTCIDLARHGVAGVARQLERAAADWPAWSERTVKRFREVVDFDAEFERVKGFLETLQ